MLIELRDQQRIYLNNRLQKSQSHVDIEQRGIYVPLFWWRGKSSIAKLHRKYLKLMRIAHMPTTWTSKRLSHTLWHKRYIPIVSRNDLGEISQCQKKSRQGWRGMNLGWWSFPALHQSLPSRNQFELVLHAALVINKERMPWTLNATIAAALPHGDCRQMQAQEDPESDKLLKFVLTHSETRVCLPWTAPRHREGCVVLS